MEEKIRQYREYKRLAEEAQAIADSLADELKAELTAQGQTKLIVGEYKVSYTDCIRKDIDKKALQADYSDIYNQYVKETSYKRFSVC